MERAELEQLVRATGAARGHAGTLFLRDPHWSPIQQAAFDCMIRPETGDRGSQESRGWLGIPTGGSGGGLRFARHDEATLGAAVRGFCDHFSLPVVNAVDVLPPWHVSGLMARVRCASTGGRHVPWTWKQLQAGDFPVLADGRDWVLSVVPTQLQRLLTQPTAIAWLRRLRLIFIGGGPVWTGLLAAATEAGLPVVLSYGMTETAAMVAAQTLTDFAAGDRSSGRAMPHAKVEICDDTSGGILPRNTTGLVRISGDSVMRGYIGEPDVHGSFLTTDLGRMDDDGRLHIVGRSDDIIITGGEKVNPREVEAVLRGAGLFADVAVIGLPHAEWGGEVVACYLATQDSPDATLLERTISRHLARQQRPKRWIAFTSADWPRNAQGKVNRAALIAAASALRDPRGELRR